MAETGSSLLPDPPVRRTGTRQNGTVVVTALVPGSTQKVWTSLTDRERVSQWFGDLTEPLRSGGTSRLEFGDGDFFEITDIALHSQHGLSYTWRFLGTGPRNLISWSIGPRETGCEVTVTDQEPQRSEAEAAELAKGWIDFVERLQRYVADGRRSRYFWRQEFDGSAELSVDAETGFAALLSPEGQRGWLPWSAPVTASGSSITIDDGLQPERFEIAGVRQEKPGVLQLQLACTAWRHPTECRIAIQDRADGALLVVSHTGWDGISEEEGEQRRQRRRFGQLWTGALRRAPALAGRSRLTAAQAPEGLRKSGSKNISVVEGR